MNQEGDNKKSIVWLKFEKIEFIVGTDSCTENYINNYGCSNGLMYNYFLNKHSNSLLKFRFEFIFPIIYSFFYQTLYI